jgi:hypothetical protein
MIGARGVTKRATSCPSGESAGVKCDKRWSPQRARRIERDVETPERQWIPAGLDVEPRAVGGDERPDEAAVVDVARRAHAGIEAARPLVGILGEEKGIGVDRRRQGLRLLAGAQGLKEGHVRP